MIMTLTNYENKQRMHAKRNLRFIAIIKKVLADQALDEYDARFLNKWEEWSNDVFSRTDPKIDQK